ncbi:ankyrin repeat-containing domain protein [Penicillium canariense]|uniref:Ankyrin repeat-containing domain protein n=1 Tax=Penicillium canariense TaxID=189055 RepID=A0A9W9HX47_9EURO|nr:ankyrin repeat-containing domain protein [Penicillium canariense]KAJ5157785.1 ankyrin repeat-containing domain protein [Penicillium canariense]
MDWEAQKAEIERLYLTEGRTLNDVMHIMEASHGFYRGKGQYTSKLKQWGFKKYKAGPEKWKYIKKKIEERRQQKKESAVYIDRILQEPKKVKYEIGRQAFQSTFERFCSAPSPKTPEGVLVCTPRESTLQTRWPSDLPWFRFSRAMFSPTYDDDIHVTLSTMFSSLSAVEHLDVDLRMLLSVIPFLTEHGPDNEAKSNRDEVSGLHLIMPEEYEGQNLHTCDQILYRTTRMELPETLRVFMFLLSNNFPLGKYGAEFFPSWDVEQEHRLAMVLLNAPGLAAVDNLRHLLFVGGPTAEAIFERIFQSALRLHDLRALRMMLEAGINPNTTIRSGTTGKASPLEFAAVVLTGRLGLEMSQLLLSFKADINNHFMMPAIDIAIRMGKKDLAQFLISQGAKVGLSSLKVSIMKEDSVLVDLILTAGLNPDMLLSNNDSSDPEFTALGQATICGNLTIAQMLLSKGTNVNAAQMVIFQEEKFQSTALGLASRNGNLEMMLLLLKSSAHVDSKVSLSPAQIPCLVLAVAHGQRKATQLLLQFGADIDAANGFRTANEGRQKTLVERALDRKDFELHQILLKWGAQPVPHALQEYYSSQLPRHIRNDDFEAVDWLIRRGALVNYVFNDFPDRPLGMAIAQGNIRIIHLLRKAGAVASELVVPYLADLRTAEFLNHLGILPEILKASGPMILTSAISSEDRDLVQYLLARGVGQDGHPGRRPSLPACKTPLEAAFLRKDLSVARILIAKGASVGETEVIAMVWQAILRDDIEILEQFLAFIPDGLSAPTAVGTAILASKPSFVCLLKSSGIMLEGKAYLAPSYFFRPEAISHKEGWWHSTDRYVKEEVGSVLEIAARCGTLNTLQFLLDWGTWTREERGRALTAGLSCGHDDIVSHLLEMDNVDVNQGIFPPFSNLSNTLIMRHPEEYIPLQLAVRSGNIELTKLLLTRGADINCLEKGIGGTTPLQQAANKGNTQLLTLLLDAGADVNHPPCHDGGATALQYAAFHGYISIVRQLLDAGADVNAQGSMVHGRTALEGAAENGRLDTVQLLLDRGASIKGMFRQQLVRAVELADIMGHCALARFLKSLDA